MDEKKTIGMTTAKYTYNYVLNIKPHRKLLKDLKKCNIYVGEKSIGNIVVGANFDFLNYGLVAFKLLKDFAEPMVDQQTRISKLIVEIIYSDSEIEILPYTLKFIATERELKTEQQLNLQTKKRKTLDTLTCVPQKKVPTFILSSNSTLIRYEVAKE
jgi:hypothetical protein